MTKTNNISLYLLLTIVFIDGLSDLHSSRYMAGQNRVLSYVSKSDCQPVAVSLPYIGSSAQGFYPEVAPSFKRIRKSITTNIYLRSNPSNDFPLVNLVLDNIYNSRRYLPLWSVEVEDAKRIALRCCKSYSLAPRVTSRSRRGYVEY